MIRIIGQITGFQTGFDPVAGVQTAEFIDQDGNVLATVPRSELGKYMAVDGSVSGFFVDKINGVPVWEYAQYRPVDITPPPPMPEPTSSEGFLKSIARLFGL
jgi:hypothetical protein